LKRREVIKTSLVATAASVLSGNNYIIPQTLEMEKGLKGKIKHSACRWCYKDIPLEELADKAKDMGISSIELLDPSEWDTVIRRGLKCAISNGSKLGITKGFNDVQYHDQLYSDYEKLIPMASDTGIKQIICFSGNRGTITDKMGLEHCAKGLDKLVKLAAQYKVTLVMELLNSKVDHGDYMCDNTKWGTALVDKLGSENFKLLYDIYHMQIMEGDVIATIEKYKKYISHFHTGGVPGRHEINETQELNYKAIMQAIVKTGFTGFVAQEFIPSRKNALESLKEGIQICDVI
jgi:hydroxypyruvate isomerase